MRVLLIVIIFIGSSCYGQIIDEKIDTTLNNKNSFSTEQKKPSQNCNIISEISLGLLVGICSGIITTVLIWIIDTFRIRRALNWIIGNYIHIKSSGEVISGCQTRVKRKSRNIFSMYTTTSYGNWYGNFEMSRNIPNSGIGTFVYENKSESGSFQILRASEKSFYFFPNTLTHLYQKRKFYVMEKLK